MNTNYPYWRVILGFTLCPALAGYSLGMVMVFDNLLSNEASGLLNMIRITLFTPLITSIAGFIFFCIPAGFAALVYSMLRLYKSWYSYLFVMLCGGGAAHLWELTVWVREYEDWVETLSPDLSFFLGASSSLLMAYFVLPKKLSRSHIRDE